MNTENLNQRMKQRGISPRTAAEHLNMTEKTFCFKLKTGDFGTDEVGALIRLLKIQDPAGFFYPKSNLKSSKLDIK